MEILTSWQENASAWIKVIEQGQIASRKTTNRAIVDTLTAYGPKNLCDIGCGEGWLTRACIKLGIATIGIDGTNTLVEYANQQKSGRFYLLKFEEIITSKTLPQAPYEAVVLNFCLYEKGQTNSLLNAITQQLCQRKLIFIQTLHPTTLLQSGIEYKDQWITNSWAGLPSDFKHPHRWYYRTLESWFRLFRELQLSVVEIKEPIAEKSKYPCSIIFVLQASN